MSEQKNVNTIIKAADILKCITRGINQSSNIAGNLELSRSTTHRLLKTLQAAEFVVQDPITLRYSLGPFAHYLADYSTRYHHNLIFCALPEMEKLRSITDETIVLVIRTGLRRMYLEELPSFQPLKYAAGKGYSPPIYAGATGKVLLAQMPSPELLRLIDTIGLEKVAPNTITDRKALLKEIEDIRRKGYAVSCSELVVGAGSVAVPIKNYSQSIAMCVLGPENRIVNRVDEILIALRTSASAIEKALGKQKPDLDRDRGL
ncbi:MAG: IclR family transcriptional regulator [Deltaproteobacteria bacterium]|nr:MAG: IclR family transcriptional regulator [Deltaproteobacteria bacterium]